MKLILTVLSLALFLSAQQVQLPPVYFGGPFGSGGPFPIFNSGTINMPADANYTMVFPDTSAHVLRITSAVALTTTRSIIAPQSGPPFFGFEFIVENATTGNQAITLIGTSGTGVTIPNGNAALVIYDGTNYVSVGSAGGGAGPLISPVVIRSIDGVNSLTINVPNSGAGDPNLVSSTGTIQISHLFVSDLAGSGTSCLQADQVGNVSRAGPPCGSGIGGGVTSVGLASPNPSFSITGSPITTAGTINLDFVPQSTGFVLAGAANATLLTPAIVQSNICPVATGTTITCTFANPTTAGNLVAVGTPRNTTTVTDNLSQTYTVTPLSFVPTFYKESTAAGVTSITATSTNNGGAIIIWEISNIVPSSALDSDSYNVGNITGPGTPITWAAITSSAQNDIFLGYWTCPNNSTTQPTAASPFTLGGYQALGSNSWSVGWVWNVNPTISTDTPVVGTANCPAQQWTGAVAFRAGVSPLSAPPSFRPLLASDLPRTPWSSLGNPTPNALTQLDMNTGLTLWYGNVNATGTNNDYGSSLGFLDTSTAPFSAYRDLVFMQGEQSNVRPLDVASYCTGGPCAGFYVDGPTGNIVMYPNAGVQIPGTGGLVSGADITSDTAMNAPVFNVCTPTNPCIQPSRAVAAKVYGMKTPTESPVGPPPTKVTGGEPLSTFHLHDFSATLPTDGQVPIFSAAQGKYVPGAMTGGGGGGGINPPYTIKPIPGNIYSITAADFASCVTLTNSGATNLQATLPSTIPPIGQCIIITNYGQGNIQVNTGGHTINGAIAASIIPGSPNSSYFSNSSTFISTGSDYISDRSFSAAPWSEIQSGQISNRTLSVSNGATLRPVNNGVIEANQVNGGTIPPSTPILGTNAQGQIIAGTPSGGAINPPYSMKAVGNPYTVVADDFASCVTLISSFTVASSIIMPTTPPPNGQCVRIINYGTGSISINPSGNTVNGGSVTTATLPGYSQSLYFSNSVMYISNGTGYIQERYMNSIPWGSVQSGSLGNTAITMGSGGTLNPISGGIINANQVNGAAIPPSLTSVGTDASGRFIAGTGGGGGGNPPWSSITAPTQDLSVQLGNWRTVFQPNFSGDNTGGTSFAFQQTGGPGTGTTYTILSSTATSSNVSPFNVTNSGGNGLRIDSVSQGSAIRAMGTSKFLGPVQLTGTNNAPSLATDGSGNIIPGSAGGTAYQQRFQGVTMGGTAGPLQLTAPECSFQSPWTCTITAPTVDTSYRLAFTVTQTTPGAGCTTAGSVQFWISYTNADSDFVLPIGSGNVATFTQGGGSLATAMSMGNAANGTVNMWTSMPAILRVKANTSVTYRMQQNVAATCTTSYPIFTVYVALLGD